MSAGYQYIPHTGGQQRIRAMNQQLRDILNSKDPQVHAAALRCAKTCTDEPDVEYTTLHLMCAAQAMSKDTGIPWFFCMNQIMDKFDARAKEDGASTGATPTLTANGLPLALEEAPEAGTKGPSFFGRLLRAVVAREGLQGVQGTAEAREYQQPGVGAGVATPYEPSIGDQREGDR